MRRAAAARLRAAHRKAARLKAVSIFGHSTALLMKDNGDVLSSERTADRG